MHSLLRRQMKKCGLATELGAVPGIPPDFLRAVDAAYRQYDDDRQMLERSLELSSRELLHANADARALLQSLPDLFLRLDAGGRILDCRGAAAGGFFPDVPTPVGRDFVSLADPDARVALAAALRHTSSDGRADAVEYSVSSVDGTRHFEARVTPGLDGQVFAILRDITAVKTAARQRERHTAQLLRQQAALHGLASSDESDPSATLGRACSVVAGTLGVERAGIWFLTEDGAAITCAWLHTSAGLQRAPGITLARNVHPRYFQALDASLTIAAEDARTDERTAEFTEGYLVPLGITSMLDCAIRVDGQPVGVLCLEHVGPPRAWSLEVQDFAAAVASFVALSHSIDQRRELETQLRQAQKMEAVGVLAGGVAHDFNNLLTAILGFSELVRMNPRIDEATRTHIAEVIGAGHRASELTSRLLAFGRKQARHPRVIEFNDLIRGSTRLLERVVGEAIDFRVEPAAETLYVLADPHQVEQVLMNLVVNARDAMRDRGGILRITTGSHEVTHHSVASRVSKLAAGRYAVLAVSDTGVGIAPEVVPRVFEPFYTTKPGGEGTGLGLSMVYGIVQQSGGHIEVESTPGVGTTFRVLLPSTTAVPATPTVETPEGVLEGGSETILLVEDEAIVRLLAVQLLERLGYRVLVASRPSEAVRLARAHAAAIDLLLSDLVMPEMNGRQLYSEVARAIPNVRVMFMSGYAPTTVLRNDAELEDVSYLQKPFTFKSLADGVRRELDGPRVAPLARF